jgi:hypothetical protein
MTCKFNSENCSPNCKKYLFCSYYSIQNQFIELQSQINFIYTTIADILKKNEENNLKIKLLEDCFYKYVCKTDSELKDKIKESDSEKEN